MVKILQWNAHTLTSVRVHELGELVDRFSIDIIAIQESLQTGNQRNKSYKDFIRFNSVYEETNPIATFLHQSLDFERLLAFELHHDQAQSQVFKINLDNYDFILVHAYLRNGSENTGIRLLIESVLKLQNNGAKILIVGDLNARCAILGNGSRRNLAGVFLDSVFDSEFNMFTALNDGSMTFFRTRTKPSAVDASICSAELLPYVKDWVNLPELDSDHSVLITTMHSKSKEERNPRFTLNRRTIPCLDHYKPEFVRILNGNIHRLCSHKRSFSGSLMLGIWDAFNFTYPKVERNNYQGFHWEAELRNLALERNKRRLDGDIEGFLQIRSKIEKLNAKKNLERLHQFLGKLKSNTPAKIIFDTFRKARGTSYVPLTGSNYESARRTAAQFCSFSKPRIVASVESKTWWEENKKDFFTLPDIMDAKLSKLNSAIDVNELHSAIFSLKKKSTPGPDGIPYVIYRLLDEKSMRKLTEYFNTCFLNGELPLEFKKCFQVAIPKSVPGEFRPISLLSSLLKIFEKLIKTRLNSWMNSVLPDNQYGFRHGVGSADTVANLTSFIQGGFQSNKYTLVVYCDIRKAFDCADSLSIKRKLMNNGLRGPILWFLTNLLESRKAQCILKNAISEEYELEEGTPQGGILSPDLWNIFYSDIPQDNDIVSSVFADDTAFCIQYDKSDKQLAFQKMNALLDKVSKWAIQNRIEFSARKCEFVVYSRNILKTKVPDIYMTDLSGKVRLSRVQSYKYLGLVLDYRLTFREHIRNMCKELDKRLTVFRFIGGSMKADRKTMELLYRSYIQGFTDYGTVVYGCASPCVLEKLHAKIRKFARILTGSIRGTRNEELIKEAYIQLPKSRRELFLLRLRIRIEHSQLRSMKSRFSEFCDVQATSRHSWIFPDMKVALVEHNFVECKVKKLPQLINNRARLVWKKAPPWIYHSDKRVELLSARIRMNNIPTKKWASRFKIDKCDLCRHCHLQIETMEHLLYCKVPDVYFKHQFDSEGKIVCTTEAEKFQTIETASAMLAAEALTINEPCYCVPCAVAQQIEDDDY